MHEELITRRQVHPLVVTRYPAREVETVDQSGGDVVKGRRWRGWVRRARRRRESGLEKVADGESHAAAQAVLGVADIHVAERRRDLDNRRRRPFVGVVQSLRAGEEVREITHGVSIWRRGAVGHP